MKTSLFVGLRFTPAVIFASLVAATLAACFNPSYSSPGFYCHPDDNPACPDGQTCVNGQCTSSANGVTLPSTDSGVKVTDAGKLTPDMTTSSSTDGMTSPSDDLSTPPSDDMAKGKADMSMCLANGGDCDYHKDALCCSGYCDYNTEKCIAKP